MCAMENKILIFLLIVTNIITMAYFKNKLDILEEYILIQGDNIDLMYDDILTIENELFPKTSK